MRVSSVNVGSPSLLETLVRSECGFLDLKIVVEKVVGMLNAVAVSKLLPQ